jgi:hypothetical protein
LIGREMILGIDTSTAHCAVALLGAPINAGDPVVERREVHRPIECPRQPVKFHWKFIRPHPVDRDGR